MSLLFQIPFEIWFWLGAIGEAALMVALTIACMAGYMALSRGLNGEVKILTITIFVFSVYHLLSFILMLMIIRHIQFFLFLPGILQTLYALLNIVRVVAGVVLIMAYAHQFRRIGKIFRYAWQMIRSGSKI